jgi:aminopeptidase YwaD
MRTTSRHLRSFLLIIAAVASAFTQQQQPVPTSVPSVERLRGHIEYLASDKLEGRRTGSPGANLAAEYIAREFARYGLRRSIGYDTPGMSHFEADSPRRYLQQFPYVARVELGGGNELSLRAPDGISTRSHVGGHWLPLGFSSNTRIDNAPAVFVGYGVTASELKYDDYAGANATGKIVIAFSGTPDGDNPHGEFARYEDARWKAIAARNAGAKALMVIARETNFQDDRLSRLRYDNSGGEAGTPVVVISRSLAAFLLHLEDTDQLNQLEQTWRDWSLERSGRGAQGRVTLNSRFGHAERFAITLTTDIVRREVPAYNVIGILEGSDASLKSEAIVIGAHYDHLGHGGEGSLVPREGEIHHGADDNASGVAGVLELARRFATHKPRPRRTIVFIAFSGEEEGLLGSNYYVNHPIVPLANTVAMINMDMIGRMKANKLIVGGVGTAQEWRHMIASANASERMNVTVTGEPAARASGIEGGKKTGRGSINGDGAPIVVGANGRTIVSMYQVKPVDLTLNEDGYGPSDHSSFYAKQIPVLFFWTGTHEDYHKPSDTADKINYEDEVRILDLVVRIVHDIDASDKRPAYTVAKTESTGRSTGFRVYLGTIPNYADSNDGLLLDGVRDDSPAAEAGLKAGDRIVKIAGRDVRNVYDYTYALGEMKAGQEYEVELLRGSERLKLKLTPTARK